jgi:hypothetical protein
MTEFIGWTKWESRFGGDENNAQSQKNRGFSPKWRSVQPSTGINIAAGMGARLAFGREIEGAN